MKKDYTILIPNMLPLHFRLVAKILETYGLNVEILDTRGPEIGEMGLKYVHNDTCYPAILCIGQFMEALQSGRYDPHKVALMLFQTGGGCRASNYISLLRKGLINAGMEYVPVISFSLAGIEKHPGFELSVPMLHRMIYAIMYGDLMMLLVNQVRPYENNKGDAARLAEEWTNRLAEEMHNSRLDYKKIKKNYRAIIEDFKKIPVTPRPPVLVGIVGEIYVKYSPLGNNYLEDFLVSEGAETVVPGLLDFFMYCVYNGVVDSELYGIKKTSGMVNRFAFNFLLQKQRDLITIIKEDGTFRPMTAFDHTLSLIDGFIGKGTKMGEGWLLSAEMLELADSGVPNIVCTQPFGCLPNHICGKGMMKPIKEKIPGVNIVAIDYDAGATAVNQENRLKLMLSFARERAGVKA
ncbi:MAG: 2-hydroxyglutaryl-CoA dehydratase [Ruminococcaceae bacterium]|nr:2-hydroxyglutaryl-CoA dehydratase [Oscillospiraceae bacterium]